MYLDKMSKLYRHISDAVSTYSACLDTLTGDKMELFRLDLVDIKLI